MLKGVPPIAAAPRKRGRPRGIKNSQKVTEDEDEDGAGGEEVEEESGYKESFSLVRGQLFKIWLRSG